MTADRPNVLIVDYWSDRNRGDAAMQIATAELVRKYAPGAKITVMTAYGWNQWPELCSELDETSKHVDAIVGGIRPTFTPIEGSGLRSAFIRRGVTLVSTMAAWLGSSLIGSIVRKGEYHRFLPKRMRRSAQAISEADIVIWNGRNFRSDSPKREPYEIWQLLYNPKVCFRTGAPVVMIGASVWPLKTRSARRQVAGAIRSTAFTSLRERNSYDVVTRQLGVEANRVKVLPDLSLAALRDGASELPEARVLPQWPRRVALTVVDWPNLGVEVRDDYVRGVAGLCRYLIANGAEAVDLIPQVTYEMESTSRLSVELRNLVGERLRVADGKPQVSDLASIYAQYDFLIATRMHSAIFASSRRIPVMTIPYDEGGKWGILDMMGVSGVDTPYAFATEANLIRKFDEVWARRDEIRASLTSSLPALMKSVDDNVRLALELVGH